MFNEKLYAELCKQYGVDVSKEGNGVIIAGDEISMEDIQIIIDSINPETTELYVAFEMYKQFMKDDMLEFAKVRRQILKNQKVNYFEQK